MSVDVFVFTVEALHNIHEVPNTPIDWLAVIESGRANQTEISHAARIESAMQTAVNICAYAFEHQPQFIGVHVFIQLLSE